ncbi:VOC family protein [Spirosoma litoris]
MISLKLIVVRSNKSEELAKFYSLLGLQFDYHRHGNSPYHYSAQVDEATFEIYPLLKNQSEPDKSLRLGFSVNDFEAVIQILKSQSVQFISEPEATDFGYLAVVEDLDGRRIELYKKE